MCALFSNHSINFNYEAELQRWVPAWFPVDFIDVKITDCASQRDVKYIF